MWKIGDIELTQRFFLGTAGYPSLDTLMQAIRLSKVEIITMSLTRAKFNLKDNQFFNMLSDLSCKFLPNTAGCVTAHEAISTALLAREVFNTNWIKLEVIGDDYTLNPNSIELLKATEALLCQGFFVFPYCIDDVVICKELVDLGCEILMPMGAPIGSGQGILNLYNLTVLRNKFPDIKLVVDSGIGRPSDATKVMEIGFDAVLLNSAVSQSVDPINMARAFNLAIESGRIAYESGIMPKRDFAVGSTPYSNRPFIESITPYA